jgi:hypothetical protein
MMRRAVFEWALFLTALAGTGCEQAAVERVPVAGKVLIDGQPLTEGTIRFVPELGRPASSAILADGSFELASDSVDRSSQLGIPRGTYRVQVTASKILDEETVEWKAPAAYADFRTSGLNVTVDRPTRDLLIELTWSGDKLTEAQAPNSDAVQAAPDLADVSPPDANTDKESKP